MTRPTNALGWVRSRAQTRLRDPSTTTGNSAVATVESAVPNAWVDIRVNQVREQIDHDEHDRKEQDNPLYHRVVPSVDGVQQQAPDARPCEHRLGQDGAPEQG